MRKSRVRWLKQIRYELWPGQDPKRPDVFRKLKKIYNKMGYEKFVKLIKKVREERKRDAGRRRLTQGNSLPRQRREV
jgi:hypothetical protein